MQSKKIRFGLVGIANTAIDLGAYSILTGLGLSFVAANFVSTSLGIAFSYTFNRSFTFQNRKRADAVSIGLFLGVTLFGLWVIHPVVIYFSMSFFSNNLPDSVDFLDTIAPKGLAIVVSLVWNYVWYSRLVFKDREHDE